jgi:hypothetical protein
MIFHPCVGRAVTKLVGRLSQAADVGRCVVDKRWPALG